MWSLDVRLRENEQKTEKLFRLLQTREHIDLGMTKLYDTTYKTEFGRKDDPSPIHFEDTGSKMQYTYSASENATINSSRPLPQQEI